MIASVRDVLVLTRADFEQLPDDGRWEVVDGRAILMPPPRAIHQKVSDTLVRIFHEKLRERGSGFVVSAAGVFIPRLSRLLGEIQYRTPDVVVSSYEPKGYYEEGQAPELVIEILSTRRGNVERSEKVEDYSSAGIGEYWIVNPIDRAVEVYSLEAGDYKLVDAAAQLLRPQAFPGVEIDMREVWLVLD